MAARLGAVEIKAMLYGKSPLFYFFLRRYTTINMPRNAGFFPISKDNLKRFSVLMEEDMHQVDILFSWRPEELLFKESLRGAFKASLSDTYIHPEEEEFWTKYLSGKKVLVIHPFASSIEQQYYNNRTKLFFRPDFIPEFSSLSTLKAVQSISGNNAGFETWFDALDHMKKAIDQIDFEIALIGCGAYGFPLAAYIKRIGKQAIQLGGVLQLFFGIKGKRWDNWGIYNDYWVSPSIEETPQGFNSVENGCYW